MFWVQFIKNNDYKLYDFTKISLFIPYKEYLNNLSIILVKWYELSKVLLWFIKISLLTYT